MSRVEACPGTVEPHPRAPRPVGLDAARQCVLREATVLPEESVPLAAALGRRLAGPITARGTQPPADVAAMDGYAVRAEDVAGASPAAPTVLRVVGVSRAGGPPAAHVSPGEAVRIATGARLPIGADSVVRQEGCGQLGEDRVAVRSAALAGGDIRRAGEEYRPGDLLLEAGAACTPAAIGLLASDGWEAVPVHRRPRVSILSLGDELREPSDGRRDANQPMLRAACESLGAVVVATGLRGDDAAAASDWLALAAERSDVLISSGSASVGDYDVAGEAWRQLGVLERFRAVAIRPGKPCHFGVMPGGPLVFALPGNPLAALTGFEELVEPALETMSGGRWQPGPRLRLPLAETLRLQRDARYLPRLESGVAVHPPDRHGSAPLHLAARADCSADWQGPCHQPQGWPVWVRPTHAALRGRWLRPAAPLPRVVAVHGDCDSGKTRLIEQLIPALRLRGLRVGTLKHAHHPLAWEARGKDTERHARAGASVVLAVGPNGAVLTRHEPFDQPLGAWLEQFAGEVEIVLVEGYKSEAVAHIAIDVGGGYDMVSGHAEGLRCWRVSRPAGPEVTFPASLIEGLASDLAAEPPA